MLYSQSSNKQQKITDITTAISNYISDNCNCRVFSPQYIVNPQLVCGKDKEDELIFVGSALSVGHINSTVIRDTFIQEYLTQGGVVTVAGQVVKINNYCSAVVTEEETHPSCLASSNATTAPSSGSSVWFIVIGVAVGVLLVVLLLIGILVVCVCCCRRGLRRKYNIHNLAIS